MQTRAVIFDLGGVVFDSPFVAIQAYRNERSLPEHLLGKLITMHGEAGAWQRLERGELTPAEFCAAFDADARSLGAEISARELLARVEATACVRPSMLAAIRALRARGLRVAALTNNWLGGPMQVAADALRSEVDAMVESARVGMRKPDTRIYMLACKRLGVFPREAVFLDDIGSNVKAASALGMRTVLVREPAAALHELGAHVGFSLLG